MCKPPSGILLRLYPKSRIDLFINFFVSHCVISRAWFHFVQTSLVTEDSKNEKKKKNISVNKCVQTVDWYIVFRDIHRKGEILETTYIRVIIPQPLFCFLLFVSTQVDTLFIYQLTLKCNSDCPTSQTCVRVKNNKPIWAPVKLVVRLLSLNPSRTLAHLLWWRRCVKEHRQPYFVCPFSRKSINAWFSSPTELYVTLSSLSNFNCFCTVAVSVMKLLGPQFCFKNGKWDVAFLIIIIITFNHAVILIRILEGWMKGHDKMIEKLTS